MKKYRVLFAVFISFLLVPICVSAETIADFRAEIKDIEAQKAESESKSASVQKRIDEANARIDEITRQIVQARKDQESTQKEINDLNSKIDDKKEEIKDLVAFYQISENDNFYLKFIFGADSFEDFIYRFSVAEQLTDANDKLVDEMNGLIKENKKKAKELKSQEKRLDSLNAEITKEIAKLGNKRDSYIKEGATYDEQIASLEKQIAFYKKAGCGENDNVFTCGVKSSVPSSSGFIIPTGSGFIEDDESEWGYSPMRGRLHAGIDVSGVSLNSPVYAVASGVVSDVTWWTYGGNVVMIRHVVNGNKYTSIYLHLNSTSVSIGQVVNRGQQIGGAGGSGGYPVHLHLEMMYGHGGYSMSSTFNPRSVINFPSQGVWW